MDLKKIKTYINRIPEDKLRNIVEEAVGKSEYLEDLIVDYVYENYSEERKELKENCVKEALSSALDAFEEFDPFDEDYEDFDFPYTDVSYPWENLASIVSVDTDLISPELKRRVWDKTYSVITSSKAINGLREYHETISEIFLYAASIFNSLDGTEEDYDKLEEFLLGIKGFQYSSSCTIMLAVVYHHRKNYERELEVLNIINRDRNCVMYRIKCLEALGRKEEAIEYARDSLNTFSFLDDDVLEYIVSSFTSLDTLLEFYYHHNDSFGISTYVEERVRVSGNPEILSDFLVSKFKRVISENNAVELYKEIKGISPEKAKEIFDEIKNNPKEDKDLAILLCEGEKGTVAKAIEKYEYSSSFSYLYLDDIAETLKYDYPKEVVEYHIRKALSRIESRKSTLYEGAVEALKKAKFIAYESGFGFIVDSRIEEIKRMHSRKSSLMFWMNKEGL